MNSLADFFKTEKGVDLEVLTTATLSKLEEIKEKTATGQWSFFHFAHNFFLWKKKQQQQSQAPLGGAMELEGPG